MAAKTIPDEKALIDEVMRRRGSQTKRIPPEKMNIFKAKLGDETQRTGGLRQEFVDELLRKLKNGEL